MNKRVPTQRPREENLPSEKVDAICAIHGEEFATLEAACIAAHSLNALYSELGIVSLSARGQKGKLARAGRGCNPTETTSAFKVVSYSTMEHFDASILIDAI